MWLTDAKKRNARPTSGGPATPTTLEAHAKQKRAQLAEERSRLPHHLKEIADLEAEASRCVGRASIRRRKDLEERIDGLRDKVRRIERGEEEQRFEEKALPYLQAYERETNVRQMEMRLPCRRTRGTPFALGPAPASPSGTRGGPRVSYGGAADGGAGSGNGILGFVRRMESSKQGSIYDEYLAEIDGRPPPIHVIPNDVCEDCGAPMILVSAQCILVCPKCGTSMPYLDATSASMAYGDEVEFASFSYKRINHFNEWLNQFQAKETSEVPRETLDRIMARLFDQRITRSEDITSRKVREVLKELKLRKYYEHIPQITSRLTGVAPPRMTPEQEERCRLMFMAIQAPFEKWRPSIDPLRKNFLSYSYCLYKFCELLGLNQFLGCFSLLKGRDKLYKQDRIFEAICRELDWEFIPSV